VAKGDRTLTFSWISCCGPWSCHNPSSAQPSVPPRPLQVNKSPCQMSSLLFFVIGRINSGQWTPQSIHIGRVLSFFSSRRNWDSSRRVSPLTLWFRGVGTLACGRGVGGLPIPTRGHTLWYSVYISTLWWTPCP